MQEEKLKGKSPFAGHLRPTEEVLWISAQSNQSSGMSQLIALGVIVLSVLGVIMVGVFSDDDLNSSERMNIVAVVMGLTVAGIGVWLLLRTVWRFIWRNSLPERVYAITNERLLYRKKKDVASIPLENLPSVSLFLGDGSKGTFSFGAFFPMWPDVENAVEVKHMIDDAQKHRLKDLGR